MMYMCSARTIPFNSIKYTQKFINLCITFVDCRKLCFYGTEIRKLTKLKTEGSSREPSTRVKIKMLSSTVEESLEYYVGVDVWK